MAISSSLECTMLHDPFALFDPPPSPFLEKKRRILSSSFLWGGSCFIPRPVSDSDLIHLQMSMELSNRLSRILAASVLFKWHVAPAPDPIASFSSLFLFFHFPSPLDSRVAPDS